MFTIKAFNCSILDGLITILFFKTTLTEENKYGISLSVTKDEHDYLKIYLKI